MKSIFNFTSYKAYLRHVEETRDMKGFRSRIAECTGCQNAFVSQVLNGEVNFNLEQALRIGQFLQLNPDEHQYFLWMVEHGRAGTLELRRYFQNLMNQLREKNLQIKERVRTPQVLEPEAQTKYYGSWVYAAVHIAVMVPTLNTAAKISRALGLKAEKTEEALNFLVEHGLLLREGNHFKSGGTQLHLAKESANITKHHTNWRIEAIKSLDHPCKSDLHYSGISSMSHDDAEKLRALLVDTIESYVRAVEKSPEETLHAFNVDFFKVDRTDDG